MRINKINTTNFNGLLLYTNRDLKKNATIDTNNIVGIQQAKPLDYAESQEPTDIIVKNTFTNKEETPYLVFTFNQPIESIIKEYNKACRNEIGELGTALEVNGYEGVSNQYLV